MWNIGNGIGQKLREQINKNRERGKKQGSNGPHLPRKPLIFILFMTIASRYHHIITHTCTYAQFSLSARNWLKNWPL